MTTTQLESFRQVVAEVFGDDANWPQNPVIRLSGDVWELTSELIQDPDCTLEIPFDAFEAYWYGDDGQPVPADISESDVADYIEAVKTSADDLDENISKLKDPHSAGSLVELCEILNEWAEAIAYREFPSDEPQDYPFDVTSLPTFGEAELEDTAGIYSCDDTHVLIPGPQITVEQNGWELLSRDELAARRPLT